MPCTILVIAHSPTATALCRALQDILASPTTDLYPFDFALDDHHTEAQVKSLLARLPGQALILTDLAGSSPGKLAASLQQTDKVEVVSGLSLAMLLRVYTHREQPLLALREIALQAASKYTAPLP